MSDQIERRIPVIEESARIEKQVVERGVVRISTSIREREEIVAEALQHQEVDIQRVSVNKEVSTMPAIRQEGDVTIIPVVEERVVMVKKLVLVEELHVRRKMVEETVEIPVTVRSTEISVERSATPEGEQIGNLRRPP